MNDVKVSIIVPVYNPGELLKRSLDSASSQSLKDIEIICIDDGSKDGSADILYEYAERDSRFVVLSQENSGAGQARNNGLQHANGKYILFLDSDDCLENDMCEVLYNHAENLGTDLVLFDNRWYFKDESRDFIHFDSFEEDYKSFVFDYKYIHNKVLSGFFGVIWTKFYKASFLRDKGIDFPSHKLFNDIEFHIKSVLLAEKIAYYPRILYHYNKSGHSSLQTDYVDKKESMVFYDVICGIRDFLIENDFMEEFRLDFLNYSFRHLYSKINGMEDAYKSEYFLKIKSYFESLLISPEEFNQMSFRNLVIYNHIVNSNSYEEYKSRMDLFDMELINPNKYPNKKDTFDYLKELDFDSGDLAIENANSDNGDLTIEHANLAISDLDIEKAKNDSNNLYIMRLEDSLSYKVKELNDEIDKLNHHINNLKKTTDEYYRIKENYKFIQEKNKELVNENNELKKGVSYKIKKWI